MKDFTIYLCGNINGMSLEEASDWRKEAAEYLAMYEIETLDPLRGKDIEPGIFVDHEVSNQFTPGQIVTRDLADIRKSNLVLSFFQFPSIGTPMEIFYASFILHLPVIIVTNNISIKNHPWIKFFASQVYSDLNQALDEIVNYWSE